MDVHRTVDSVDTQVSSSSFVAELTAKVENMWKFNWFHCFSHFSLLFNFSSNECAPAMLIGEYFNNRSNEEVAQRKQKKWWDESVERSDVCIVRYKSMWTLYDVQDGKTVSNRLQLTTAANVQVWGQTIWFIQCALMCNTICHLQWPHSSTFTSRIT